MAQPITLAQKLNRMYLVAAAAAGMMLIIAFAISTVYYRDTVQASGAAALRNALASQFTYFEQELIGQRYYASQLRVKSTIIKYPGMEVGIYGKNNDPPVYETPRAGEHRSAMLSSSPGPVEGFFRGFAIISQEVVYQGEPIGLVVLGLSLEDPKRQVMLSTLAATLMAVLSLSVGFIGGRQWLSRVIEAPLEKLTTFVPEITTYLTDEASSLAILGDLGSSELNQLSNSLTRLALDLRESRVQQRRAEEARIDAEAMAARNMVVARTAQFITHDMKHAFGTLRARLERIIASRDLVAIQDQTRRLIPEVNERIERVITLLRELKELATDTEPLLEPTSPVHFIKCAVQVLFDVEETPITLRYILSHTRMVSADRLRLARVFQNIAYNALEAIGSGGGDMWFATEDYCEEGRTYVRFCIGNSGSFIPESERIRIFLPFHTLDKKDGTGLGLAIAHSVVTAHGGKIFCKSDKRAGTEFWLTILAAAEAEAPGEATLELPASTNA